MEIKHFCPECGAKTTIERTDYFVSVGCESCLQYWKIEEYDSCCKEPQHKLSRLITSNGTVQVKKQCSNCGEVIGNALGGYTKEQRESFPEVDKTKRENYTILKWDLIQAFHNKRRQLQQCLNDERQSQWWVQYKAYLNSNIWVDKRARALSRDKNICQGCLLNRATEVHHKSYEFVDFKGSEPLFDLVSLCNPCHEKLHQIKELKKVS